VSALVLDASAALLLVLGGQGRDAVRTALRDRIRAAEPILVPTVFWLEVIDALATGHRRTPRTLVEAVYQLDQLGLETAEVGRPGILASIDAVGRGLDVREAAYLVLAESAGADLLTASPRLAAVAGDRAMLARGRRPRAPRPDRSWIGWKGAASYLRELRSAL
jgi:predicted nucleic acid-binding protein